MTGENYIRFIRSDRQDEHLEKMKNDLAVLRDKWGEEYHRQDEEGNHICNPFVLEDINEEIEN